MTVYIDFKKHQGSAVPTGSDPYALTKNGGFPFVNDQAARDRAYSLMQQAEEKALESGFEDDEVQALMDDALELEITAIEFTGNEKEDLIQVQDLMYLFGHRMIGEEQNSFERQSEQRLLDMLEEILEETEQAASDINRGLTSQSGTYKTDVAEKNIEQAKFDKENDTKISFLLQSIHNIEELHNRLENE